VLDELARARGWPTSADVGRLGALVRKLSDAYNDPSRLPPRDDGALAARLSFSFPRDVPKGAGAVRELVAWGALAFKDGAPLRVLDVGAGLGATSRGVARALAANGAHGHMMVDAVDVDGSALAVASAIATARPAEGRVMIELRTSESARGSSQ
jgi:methylase of polypeptide subunit release factors